MFTRVEILLRRLPRYYVARSDDLDRPERGFPVPLRLLAEVDARLRSRRSHRRWHVAEVRVNPDPGWFRYRPAEEEEPGA